VRFQYARAVTQVGMCHCSKCRKVSGTASNAVIVVPEADLEWLAGRELLQEFALPDGWGATRCRTCGSPAPRKIPGAAAYWVPAGALDDDPGLGIGGHIWVGSKAAWEVIPEGPPQFEAGLPPRKPG
jgi:hypothetical protein